jgi:hypothetical protein
MSTPSIPETGCTLEDLRRSLEVGFTRIDGKLDHLTEHLNNTDKDVTEVRARIALVEQKMWRVSGAAALLGMATPYIIQFMAK